MSIPRQIQMPTPPNASDPDSLRKWFAEFSVRLANWATQVSDDATAQIMRQTNLVPAPDGATATFTIPTLIDVDVDGVPRATLVVDDRVVPYGANPPAPGTWFLLDSAAPATGAPRQQVLVNPAPIATAYFIFLVARKV